MLLTEILARAAGLHAFGVALEHLPRPSYALDTAGPCVDDPQPSRRTPRQIENLARRSHVHASHSTPAGDMITRGGSLASSALWTLGRIGVSFFTAEPADELAVSSTQGA